MKNPELKGADKLFLTKVWGFEAGYIPIFGFSSPDGRRKYIRESSPDDWIVLAGTETGETAPENKGRLLGMIKVHRQEIDLDEFIKTLPVELPPNQFDEKGKYRWPYGFAILEARAFIDKPLTRDIFGDGLPNMGWVAYALNVVDRYGKAPVEKIAEQDSIEVKLPDYPQLKQFKSMSAMFGKKPSGGPTGPGPSFSKGATEWEDGGRWVYLLKLEGTPPGTTVFKIGYSNDPECRLKTVRHFIVPEVTGFDWILEAKQELASADEAYQAEQEMLRRLSKHRTTENREIVVASSKEIYTVWNGVLAVRSWLQ